MKKIFIALALGVLFTMPQMLHAEEMVIQLMAVTCIDPFPSNGPRDGSSEVGKDPTRPTSFHATINGHTLSITKQEPALPSAEATVVNATNGGIVLNQQFTTSLQEQISNAGVYVLHIQTAGGALVGQFVVQ